MKVYGIIRTVIYWALAALLLAFVPELAHIKALRYFIGGVMMFYGVEEIVYTLFKNKRHFSVGSLYWNGIEIVIGFTLTVFVKTGEADVTYAIVCVSWAIWAILRETRELAEATHEIGKSRLAVCKAVAVVNMIESLAVIALSLTMLVQPTEHHAKIHLYLLAVELFTKVLFPILYYVAERTHKPAEQAAEQLNDEKVAEQLNDEENAEPSNDEKEAEPLNDEKAEEAE